MTDKVSFEEFQKSRVFVPDARQDSTFGDWYEGEFAQPILSYLGHLSIEIQTPKWLPEHRNHQYSVAIENWFRESDDLEELEKVLYEWYLTS